MLHHFVNERERKVDFNVAALWASTIPACFHQQSIFTQFSNSFEVCLRAECIHTPLILFLRKSLNRKVCVQKTTASTASSNILTTVRADSAEENPYFRRPHQQKPNGRLLYAQSMSNLLLQNGYVLVMASGMILCILIGGNIDLSVGSVFYLTISLCLLVGVWQGYWSGYNGHYRLLAVRGQGRRASGGCHLRRCLQPQERKIRNISQIRRTRSCSRSAFAMKLFTNPLCITIACKKQ